MYSWESFTTLGYEWSVIRVYIPYCWTIRIRDDRHFALISSHTGVIVRSTDLLYHACGRSYGRDTEHYCYGRYDTNQLSGGCHSPHLIRPGYSLAAVSSFGFVLKL